MTIRCKLEGCDGALFPGTDERAWKQHYLTHHDVAAAPSTPDEWETAARRLILEAAATHRPFTIAEALAPIGDHPDPDKRQSINGRLTTSLRPFLEHWTGGDSTTSKKPTSNASLVRVWVGKRTAVAA